VASDIQTPRALNGRGTVPCTVCQGPDPVCGTCHGTGIEGTTVVIDVRVCLGPDGRLWSSHEPSTSADRDVSLKWPGGGNRHIANALLTEAVRREAFVCLLVALTKQPDLYAQLQQASPEERDRVTRDVANSAGQSLAASLGSMVLSSTREAVAMVLGQGSGNPAHGVPPEET
jgi:hypothetical protein